MGAERKELQCDILGVEEEVGRIGDAEEGAVKVWR